MIYKKIHEFVRTKLKVGDPVWQILVKNPDSISFLGYPASIFVTPLVRNCLFLMQPDRSVTSTPISTIPGVNSYWIGGTRFDIPQVYTPIEYINRGAYGVVWFVLHDSLTSSNLSKIN